jgi:hypothetical protein
MKMDKKIIFLIMFIAAGLFLFGCLDYIKGGKTVVDVHKVNQTGNETTNQTAVNETNQTTVTPKACEDLAVGKEDCIIGRAFNNNRYSDCQMLNGSWYTQCVYKLAEISYVNCLRLINSEEADDCLVNISAKAGDIACQDVINATKKDNCIIQSLNVDCRSIANIYDRYVCNAIANNNEAICEKESDHTGHDSCYLEFSIKKRNVCDQIDNEGIRMACIGLLSNNSGQCAEITSATLIRDNCYKTYAEKGADCSLCSNVMDSVYKDDCFVECAVENSNPSACAYSNEEQKADNCYWQYAVKTKNISYCNQIKLKSLIRVCAEDIAKAESKPSDCNIILGVYGLTQKDLSNCYLDTVTLTNVSFTNCQLMNEDYIKDQCTNMAIKRDAMSTDYCAYIADDGLKAACFKS